MNLTELRRRFLAVRDAFDEAAAAAASSSASGDRSVSFLHAFAVKANPLQAVLEAARGCGFGAEAASWAEFRHAERLFGGARRVVFDSPAKTRDELRAALRRPCRLNADSLAELERIAAIAEEAEAEERAGGETEEEEERAEGEEEERAEGEAEEERAGEAEEERAGGAGEAEGPGGRVRGRGGPPAGAPAEAKAGGEERAEGKGPEEAEGKAERATGPGGRGRGGPPGAERGAWRVRATVGLRVNPQTVSGASIAALSTGEKVSKFGVGLHDEGNRRRIIDAFRMYHEKLNLRMLHVHSGSQGLGLQTLVDGVKTIVESLADDEELAPFVDVIDIGGGLPVNFAGDEDIVTCATYANALREQVPTLFRPKNGKPRLIITEFGRAVAAKSGVMISRVEYVKMSGGRRMIQQHIGADLAVRTVWQPESWPLRVFVYDAAGHRKVNNPEKRDAKNDCSGDDKKNSGDGLTDVVGPCCNSGCALTRAAVMPENVIALEDTILVADVGAYYHSSYSLYNMRPMPACYVYDEEAEKGSKLRLVKRAQAIEDVMNLFLSDS